MTSKELASALENRFVRLNNVHSAHVDFDENEEILAIGIFSDGLRHPKEIKRDVEETFRRVAGYRVNHNKISIVEERVDLSETPPPRLRFLTAYQVQKGNDLLEGVVQLQFQEQTIVESKQVHPFEMKVEMLIANTTAAALARQFPNYNIRVDMVKEVDMGNSYAVCVTLSVVHKQTGAERRYVGAAMREKDTLASVAKATLDALNRRITWLSEE